MTDIPDLIASTLGVSRATAYDMMRTALAEAQPQQEPAQQEFVCSTGLCHYRKPLDKEQ